MFCLIYIIPELKKLLTEESYRYRATTITALSSITPFLSFSFFKNHVFSIVRDILFKDKIINFRLILFKSLPRIIFGVWRMFWREISDFLKELFEDNKTEQFTELFFDKMIATTESSSYIFTMYSDCRLSFRLIDSDNDLDRVFPNFKFSDMIDPIKKMIELNENKKTKFDDKNVLNFIDIVEKYVDWGWWDLVPMLKNAKKLNKKECANLREIIEKNIFIVRMSLKEFIELEEIFINASSLKSNFSSLVDKLKDKTDLLGEDLDYDENDD
jgi:hypothetical protein